MEHRFLTTQTFTTLSDNLLSKLMREEVMVEMK